MVIARMRAKKAVVAQLRAQGLKPQHYSAREIGLMADDYFAKHAEPLIKKAAADVITFPEFARYSAELDITSVRNASGNRTLGQPQAIHHEENRT